MSCRLLYLVGQLGVGGLERQLTLLLGAMDRKRYQPEVVVWNSGESNFYGPQIRAFGVPVHSLPIGLTALAKLKAFRCIVIQRRPELVHSYSFWTNIAAWWATLGTKILAIGSLRSDFIWEKREAGVLLGRLCARWPRNQIANSWLAAANVQRSQGPFVPAQVSVVRNGLDLKRYRSAPLLANEIVRIIGIGSLLPIKRWDRLLVAAQELKGLGIKFKMRVLGEGHLRRSLEEQSRSLGVADCVEFAGHNDNIPVELCSANFLAHTSETEGCPNVVLEAMASGRAVVATDVGDIPQLVDEGITGFVVPCGDEAMLVARLVTLITDRDLCQHMGEAGRVKAEREFGADRLVSETLNAYRAAGWKDQ